MNDWIWKIVNLGNGYCTIMRADTTGYYVVPLTDNGGSMVTTAHYTVEPIPDRAQWRIDGSSRGYTIQNRATGYYLCSAGGQSNTSPISMSVSTAGDRTVWSFADGNASELASVVFNPMVVDITEEKPITIYSIAAGAWDDVSDFMYSTESSNIVIDNENQTVTGVSSGYANVTAVHKVTGRQSVFQVFSGGYYEKSLVETYNFTPYQASLIKGLYDRLKYVYPDESELKIAWRYSRLLGGIWYQNNIESYTGLFWVDVAGDALNDFVSEEYYFVSVLGFTSNEYTCLKTVITDNHTESDLSKYGDFAHMQISLAARLAYYNDYDSFASNYAGIFIVGLDMYETDEIVSYLAGWLGDAVLDDCVLKNDDYIADLDAENVYRQIITGKSIIEAFNTYYYQCGSSKTRPEIFVAYISYETAKEMIYQRTVDAYISKQIELASINNDIVTINYWYSIFEDEQATDELFALWWNDAYAFLEALKEGNHTV